jgi:hypothetical protein
MKKTRVANKGINVKYGSFALYILYTIIKKITSRERPVSRGTLSIQEEPLK